jgi:hypothetical protein
MAAIRSNAAVIWVAQGQLVGQTQPAAALPAAQPGGGVQEAVVCDGLKGLRDVVEAV